MVPIDAQRLLNRLEIWRSLRTDSLSVALRRLPSVIAGIESLIEQARSTAGLSVDATLLRPSKDDLVASSAVVSVPAPISQPSPVSALEGARRITLAEAYRSYIDDPTREWSASTREAYETSRKLAVSIVGGGDVSLASISRAQCRDLLEVLRFLPANASKVHAHELSRRLRTRCIFH